MRWVRRILLLGVLVALPVGVHLFVIRNSQQVPLDLLALKFEAVHVWALLLSAFVSGIAVASVVSMLRGARLRLEARRYRKATRELESEVHQLRNLPLAPDRSHASETGGELSELTALERGS